MFLIQNIIFNDIINSVYVFINIYKIYFDLLSTNNILTVYEIIQPNVTELNFPIFL